MSRLRKLWILVAVLLAVPLWWAFTFYLHIRSHPKAEVHTTLVLDYSGPLDASKSVVHLRIYRIEKLSTGAGDMHDIFQNRIELDVSAKHIEFMWPSDSQTAFAGDEAAIQDVDGDGIKEIVVHDGDQVRIVTFENGELRFRPNADALDSNGYRVGPFKLGKDLIFICGTLFPSQDNGPHVFIPRLFRWTRSVGFEDVTKNHADYYRAEFLPELQTLMADEQDTERKALYKNAIQQLTKELFAGKMAG
jgi:hypothetical protein